MPKLHFHLPASPKHFAQLFVKAAKAWSDDYAPSMGAAISYYTVFSLAPLLIIVIAIAGAVLGRDAVQGAIVAQLGGLVGAKGATMIQGLIANASETGSGLVAGGISIVVLIVGATSVFAELQNALDRIWHVPPAQKPQGVWAILRARVVSFGLILGLVFLLMVSLAVSAATSAFGDWMSDLFPGAGFVLEAINFVFSLAVMTVLFGMIYKLMPSTPIAWQDVGTGAVVTAVLFEVGKILIGLYIGKSNMTSSFQAAGSLVVLLVWVYYAAQIFLLGAEFTKVFSEEHGSRHAKAAMQATTATAQAGGHVHADLPATATASARLVETPASRARAEPDHDPALDGPLMKATDAGLHAALAGLFTQMAALVVVTIAGSVVSRKRKAAEDKLKLQWGPQRRRIGGRMGKRMRA